MGGVGGGIIKCTGREVAGVAATTKEAGTMTMDTTTTNGVNTGSIIVGGLHIIPTVGRTDLRSGIGTEGLNHVGGMGDATGGTVEISIEGVTVTTIKVIVGMVGMVEMVEIVVGVMMVVGVMVEGAIEVEDKGKDRGGAIGGRAIGGIKGTKGRVEKVGMEGVVVAGKLGMDLSSPNSTSSTSRSSSRNLVLLLFLVLVVSCCSRFSLKYSRR